MFGDTCSTEDCDRKGSFFTGRCDFHAALGSARELSQRELNKLRIALEGLEPLTSAEKRDRAIRSRLSSVEYHAAALADEESRAREAGASEEQIAAAKADVTPDGKNVSRRWAKNAEARVTN